MFIIYNIYVYYFLAIWNGWLEWGSCSTTCNKGKQEATRTCTSKVSKSDLLEESCQSHLRSSNRRQKDCFLGACGQWGEWEGCSRLQSYRMRTWSCPNSSGGPKCNEKQYRSCPKSAGDKSCSVSNGIFIS